MDKLRTVLEKEGGGLHVNTLNNDGFSPLDVAVLLDNQSIIKMLLQFGANEGIDSNDVETHLNTLLIDSEQKYHQLNTSPSSSSQNLMGLDFEKQKTFYDVRIRLLKRMTSGWQKLQAPNSPFSFSIGKKFYNKTREQLLSPIFDFRCHRQQLCVNQNSATDRKLCLHEG